jgi:response regulator RpfG family c-di-GMP phosphodiesterase
VDETRGTILVVDCEESFKNNLCHRLQSEGYNYIAVADGEDALWKTSAQEFDLVLLDMDMPGLSGMEVLSRIVAAHPDTCVLMITTVDDIPAAIEAMKQGAYDYVTKPFHLDDLCMRVEKALERRRLLLENREYRLRLEQRVELQVAQTRKYLLEAAQALGLEQMALDSPDAVRQAQRYAKRMFQINGTKNGSDMEEEYLQMARTLSSIAEARDPYGSGHSERVGLLANEIAIQLGCSKDMIRQIKFAAILQDIGKIVIPDQILSKQDQLTPEEYAEINRHPTAAVEIIQHVEYFKDIIPLVESHHEWYNGSGGYPRKLKGNNIPLGARILAVADAYDAMTCPRPHRSCLVPEEAAKALKKGAGKQWDPMIVDAFLRKLGVTV